LSSFIFTNGDEDVFILWLKEIVHTQNLFQTSFDYAVIKVVRELRDDFIFLRQAWAS
jgi:uncharacterized protein YkwD